MKVLIVNSLTYEFIQRNKVYVILGHHYEHIGLMLSLKRKGLLDEGEYFVVGFDIEQYDAAAPDKYLRGLLQDKIDFECISAFKSYLGIVPSPPNNFETFAQQVNRIFNKYIFSVRNSFFILIRKKLLVSIKQKQRKLQLLLLASFILLLGKQLYGIATV